MKTKSHSQETKLSKQTSREVCSSDSPEKCQETDSRHSESRCTAEAKSNLIGVDKSSDISKEQEINIVSFGAGQNSTAMIILMKNQNVKINEIIYAEVGNEMPQTYIFLKEFKKWCEKQGLNFIEVKSKLGTIKEHYTRNRIIPYRMFRHCTHKFKVVPINNWIKDNYGIKTSINMYMGIANDEKHRAEKIKGRKQFTYKFPLIEQNINRQGCIDIIKKEGLSIPVKSGCYFCPFQTKKTWLKLLDKHPELFEDSNEFEKNGRAYPEGNLIGNMTLEQLKKTNKEQLKLIPEDCAISKCIWCHN